MQKSKKIDKSFSADSLIRQWKFYSTALINEYPLNDLSIFSLFCTNERLLEHSFIFREYIDATYDN